MTRIAAVLSVIALCVGAARVLADPAPPAAPQLTAEQFMAQLKPQHGTVPLPQGFATLQLGDDFYYLNPADAEKLLVEGWGNPPGTKTLGMVIPQSVNPLHRDGWGVVITYADDGHVSDDDAAKIDYGDLLQKMQKAAEEDNAARKQKGYTPMHLVGWAEPPRYDAASHKLYWAKQYKADGAEDDTLNYEIRVLGRKGVLEMTAVSGMRDIDSVKQQMPRVLASANFSDGNRYEDFKAGTDRMAAYGLAALVAGGIAAKAGLFAKLGLILLAAKKFIVLGLAGAAAFFRKLFTGRKAPRA
ncbi:MAG: DUF2167 domain-containing protein [Nevskia sp.]|nr:DUF2167 domain-containing protein [Nevskia sp.]